MKETKIYTHLKNVLPSFRPTRIENSCELGTPDCFWQGKGGSFWTEFKQVKVGTNIYTHTQVKPDWRPGQVGWARDHIKFGGLWFLVVAVNDKIYIVDHPKVMYFVRELNPFYPSDIILRFKKEQKLYAELQEENIKLREQLEELGD